MGYFSDLNLRETEARLQEEWDEGYQRRQEAAARADVRARGMKGPQALFGPLPTLTPARYEVYSVHPELGRDADQYRASYDNLTEAQRHCRAIEAHLPADGFTYILEVES